MATAVLPDGRVVAVTGSGDATVRVWDLTTGTPIGDPLPALGAVNALALFTDVGQVGVVIGGAGIARIDLRP